MSVTITSAARSAACDAVVDLVDVSGPGYIEIWTSAFGTKLATLVMSNPAFGSASAGVATASAITSDTSADATGTAAVFKIFNGAATEILRGSVGVSGEDINFAGGVAFTAGQTVSISSMTVTMPAS